MLVPNLDELTLWCLRRRFLNFVNVCWLFDNYLPLEKICFVPSLVDSGEEDENVKRLQTDIRLDGWTDGQQMTGDQKSSGELKNTGKLFYQNQQNGTLQPLMAWIRDFRLWIAFLSCRLSSQNTGNTIV